MKYLAYVAYKTDKRVFLHRVGRAESNPDGSIDVQLDSLPIQGILRLIPKSDEVPLKPGDIES